MKKYLIGLVIIVVIVVACYLYNTSQTYEIAPGVDYTSQTA